jgi:hypothetical protein
MVTVNASDNAPVQTLLSGIRDLYGALCTMTRRFLDDFSIPALQDLLRERSVVLLKIDSERTRLLGISTPRSWDRYCEYGEIKNAISAITAYDREIAARVTVDMNSVSRELASLSSSSTAAMNYSRHRRG